MILGKYAWPNDRVCVSPNGKPLKDFKQKRIIRFAFLKSLRLPCIGCAGKEQGWKQRGELESVPMICTKDDG